MQKSIIILGPPGTGKTTKLIRIMEQEMANGVPPNKIAYCSFTRKATDEARDRAMERFGFEEADLPYFRTFHSLAFRELGLTRNCVFNWKHREEIASMLGLRFSHGSELEEGGVPSGYYNGDRYAFLDSYSRARCVTPQRAWYELGDDGLSWREFELYLATMRDYKKEKHVKEFQDMIDEYVANEHQTDIDVAIIDEAQDLSTSQWQMVRQAFHGAKRIYIAGDDDQAIYEWSGADVKTFLNLKGETITLQKSYRLPSKIWKVAHTVSSRISNRYPKDWHSRDEAGTVQYHACVDSVDISNGNWLLLARNTWLLKSLEAHVRDAGVPYTLRGKPVINPDHIKAIKAWEDAKKGRVPTVSEELLIKRYRRKDANTSLIWHEALTKIPYADIMYYISLLRGGHNLLRPPRIHINTIHGVKGGEADNVAIVTDMTERTFKGMDVNPDSEARVFYVGVTRAKESLHIIQPQTRKAFDL